MTKEILLRRRFGHRVELARQNLMIPASELARRCNISTAQLERICKGSKSRLTLAEMSVIATCLNASLYSLLAPATAPVESGRFINPVEVIEKR